MDASTGNATLRALAWTSAGLALVGVGMGVAGLVIRGGRWSDYDAQCNWMATGTEHPSASAQCGALYSDYNATGPQAMVLGGFIAGGVFAVSSAALFVASGGRRQERVARGLRCGWGPGAVGVACGGTF